ncbi:hypothetical protein [Thauera sp. 2A1]|uniref:hypothetical protein n=1 Tax=Thauera sp. 2A1 TaxID=2570191 RepID=UPI0012922D63|nr:hypothetical protein [Thauera sp. 2A1]KAI5914631.1 hypothetical protein GH664_11840 [Thauera sp. 2A1]
MIDKNSPAPSPGRVTLFGDPWHGLWTQSTGLIHTASGRAVPTLGQAPQPGPMQYESRIGDAFGVQVPGHPLVERSSAAAAADDAAGRSWPNYGILAGARRRLYGKPLHINQFAALRSWIYIDPDGGRWLITVGQNGGTEITATRFGVFPRAMGEPTAAQTVYPEIDRPFAPGSQDLYAIDDASSDGALAILVLGRLYGEKTNLQYRDVVRIWKIELAGVPPAMMATATLIYFKPTTEGGNRVEVIHPATLTRVGRVRYTILNPGPDYYLAYDINDYPTWEEVQSSLPPDHTVVDSDAFIAGESGSVYCDVSTVFGAVIHDGAAQLVRIEEQYVITANYEIDDAAVASGASSVSATGEIVESCSMRLRLYDGGPEVVCPATTLTTLSGTLGGSVPSGSTTNWLTSTETTAGTLNGVNVPVATQFDWFGVGQFGFTYVASRLSNRAWSLLCYNYLGETGSSGNASMGHQHIGVVGVSSAQQLNRTLSIGASSLHGFASAHPITGVIDWDAGDPRCWV